jgi:hypothetical protein
MRSINIATLQHWKRLISLGIAGDIESALQLLPEIAADLGQERKAYD